MAQSNNIINHWSFLAFAGEFGTKLGVGECTNHETGEPFPACTFTKGGKRTFVHFGPSLAGGLSLQQMIDRRDGLQVVELNVSPETRARRKASGKQEESYILCIVGESSWEEVDLSAYLK